MFRPKSIRTINDVVERQLCTGCGACAFAEPKRFRMDDALEFGKRPFLREDPAPETGDGLEVCPGIALRHETGTREDDQIVDLWEGWGPVYGVWEGYAVDDEIRLAGSSGGAATALALYSIEKGGMGQVIHSAANPEYAYLNETVVSSSRQDLLASTGSRYAPASPCDGLDHIAASDTPSVFIGKPCDAAAVDKIRKINKDLNKKIGVSISFFCAGVPSTFGNLELLKKNGVADPRRLKSLRYRGNGWPGLWTALYHDKNESDCRSELSYDESWGFLQRYRQWRCYICPDHTGEFADIAVGDPWYRPIEPGEPGKSLIVARTKLGLEIIKSAANAGYIVLETEDASLLPRSQPGLLSGRGAIWSRILVLQIFGIVVPRFEGFSLFRNWLKHLNAIGKLRSVTGTVKRIFVKRLRHRAKVLETVPTHRRNGL